MPPRYAYWTILIDQKPTAFRAREREELLPTFNQLRRKNTDVVMKWFARGRLWETPEEAQAALRAPRAPQEKRTGSWRPGGEHRDPRERFKKGSKPHGAPPAVRRDREKLGPGRESRPWTDKPASGPLRGSRPRDSKPSGQRPQGDRTTGKPLWRDKPPGHSSSASQASPTDRPPAGNRKPFSAPRKPFVPRGKDDQRKPWQRDRPVERRDARPPLGRKPDAPPLAPPAEQVGKKPEPPERG